MRRFVWLLVFAFSSALAQAAPADVGVVVMHGKGGSPTKWVAPLASGLQAKGYLVANLEMPWSGRRAYDVDVAAAEKETAAALDELRVKGAKRLFVAGHSQGGVFALYVGSRLALDGVIAIAPGGNVASPSFRDQLGADVAHAREMVAEGKGNEKGRFSDFEGSRGGFVVSTSAATYLTWFDPDGAMNAMKSARSMSARVPVLYIAPSNDYLALARAKGALYGALPANPLTRLAEPNAGHLEAPAASLELIDQWLKEVTATPAK